MKKGLFKKAIATFISFAIMTPSVAAIASESSILRDSAKGSYGVGVGVKWPSQVYAPYVDFGGYVTEPGYFFGYDDGGAPNLKKLYDDTGIKFYNAGFIQSTGSVVNGKVGWGWAALSSLSEGSNHEQYLGLKKSITELRKVGGDVCASFGGALNPAFWQTTQDIDVLYNTYKDIVNGYGLTRIDLDVEGDGQNKAQNIANAKAIKKLQDETGVDVSLTLPVSPNGLIDQGLNVLEAYLSNGVNLVSVNIMAMCYENMSLNYGTASVQAMNALKDQIKDYYKKYANTALNDQQAYGKVGVTVAVGFESTQNPIFKPEWSKVVYDAAKKNNIGMLSIWSINRDAKLDGNTGIVTKYENTNILKEFSNGSTNVNNKPEIYGAENRSILKGSSFNPLEGISAKDYEDGDLTNKIIVSGKVDESTIGSYTLTYEVTDSKGEKTSVQVVIKVVENIVPTYPEYDSNQVYTSGMRVIYKGIVYEATQWTQGEAPDTHCGEWQSWKIIGSSEGEVITLSMVAERYNMQKGETNWDNKYDLNADGIVDLYDLVISAKNL